MMLKRVMVLAGLMATAGSVGASDDACSVREYGFAYYSQLAGQHGRCIGPLREGLATIKLDELEGAIDADGRMLVPPRYAWLRPFSQGLAAAMDPATRKTGYIDRSGAWVIAPQFVSGENFNVAGTAVVRLDGYVQALIDRSGTVLKRMPADIKINPIYGDESFPAGLAVAEFERPALLVHLDGRQLTPPEGVWMQRWEPHVERFVASAGQQLSGLLDIDMRWVAPAAWRQIQPFNGDRAVAVLESGRMILIDRDGRQQGSAEYAQLVPVAPGLWGATPEQGTGLDLIDRSGKVLERGITHFHDAPFGDWFVYFIGERDLVLRNAQGRVVRHALAAKPRGVDVRPRLLEIELERGDSGIDTVLVAPDGRLLLPTTPDDGGDRWLVNASWKAPFDPAAPGPLATISSYRDGRDHGAGIVTSSGRRVFNPQWREFGRRDRFDADGPLVVSTRGYQDGVIDGEGRWLIEPGPGEIGGFREGWSRAEGADGQLQLIDADGRRYPVPAFGSDAPVDGLYAIDDRSDRGQVVDLASGKVLFEGRFDALRGFREGLAPARSGEQWGLVDRTGAWRVPAQYRDITPFGPRFWRARRAYEDKSGPPTVLLGPDGRELTAEPWLSIYSSRSTHSDFWEQPYLKELAPRTALQTESLVLADGTVVNKRMVKSVSSLGGGWMTLEFTPLSGYVDPHGEWVIVPTWPGASQFATGVEVARVHDGEAYQLIDRAGHIVYDPEGSFISEVTPDGLFLQQDKHDRSTQLRALGESEPRLTLEGTSYDGIADGLLVDQRTGSDPRQSDAYDLEGRRVIDRIDGRLSTFSEDTALLQATDGDRSFRYVDKRGRRAFRGDFIYATVFHGGRAVVMDAGGYRMIDPDGRTVIRIGSECGREVVYDVKGTRTWPERIEHCVE